MQKKGSLLIVLMFVGIIVFAQKKTNYEIGASSAVGTDNNLPFWLLSNQNGIVPTHGYVMGDLSLGMNFEENQNESFDFMWKASGLVYTGKESKLMVNHLYGGIRWRFIHFYIGQKSHAQKYDGLSSTNGDLLYSNNSRAYPQYELSVPEWTNVPYTKGFISFKGLLSDGITMDNRYIDNARIHHKNFYLRIFEDYKLSASAGIEHYALWAGTHPVNGNISGSLSKYMKIFMIEGDDAGSFNNDEYRLGNHIGSYRFDVYYNDDKFSLNAYLQTVFEDGSGKRMNNNPDGLYGIYYKNKKSDNALIQSAVIEYYHTSYQGGSIFQIGDHILGGRDNYFNHGEYRSGWTHQGRTIGSPLFTTGTKDGHVVIANNRFKAVHFGIGGEIFGLPYKTYFTYSSNYGTYNIPYASKLKQFSGYAEVNVPVKQIPFKIDLACALDRGKLLGDNLGFWIRLSKKGILSSKKSLK
ncbi:capsule assembly Wzi family protein [Labilibaculum euxinus]